MKTKDIQVVEKLIRRFYGESIATQLIQRRVYNHIQKYIIGKDNLEIERTYKTAANKNVKKNNTIFTCWLQGIENAPPMAKSCIKSLERLAESREKQLIIITKNNLTEYLNFPDYILNKYEHGLLSHTHFSDLIRISLIAEYGGTWADACAYALLTIPEFMFGDFFMFKQSSQLKEVRMSGNWWISAHCGNELILKQQAALFEYWKNENTLLDYYLFHIIWSGLINSSEEYKKFWDKQLSICTDNTHVLQKKINELYNEEEWGKMKQITPIFKLSYKMKFDEQQETYYKKLVNNQLL